MVEYSCDVWSKPLSTTGAMASTLGKLNSFRYRAYAYDEETELYYMLRNNPSFDPSTARIRDIAYAANYDGW